MRVQNAKGDAHCGGDADGRGAANDHVADSGGDVSVVGISTAHNFGGQGALVNHDHAGRGPFDGLHYAHGGMAPVIVEPKLQGTRARSSAG